MEIDIILASGSSRRKLLLEQMNVNFNSIVPQVDENPLTDECPIKYASRLASDKAKFAWNRLKNKIPVLGADTIICLDKHILGKPTNVEEANYYLTTLSGREHQVFTGLCIWNSDSEYDSVVETKVKFKKLNKPEIQAYCATREPYDKAGAYAIQGLAGQFIEYIRGSYTNVMGLPLKELNLLLQKANIKNE